MDFVKREDQLIDEGQYKAYLESLQKSQLDAEYQHAPISMEQLHQIQSSINNTIVHNFQLPLSPRQMSTLMLKTNQLNRSIQFNEIPAHLPRGELRNLVADDLNLHDLPQNLRHEDLNRLDLTLARNLNPDLDIQNGLTQTLVQNMNEVDLSRNLSADLTRNLSGDLTRNLSAELTRNLSVELSRNLGADLSQNLNRMAEVLPQNLRADLPQNLRADLVHSLNHELDLSHHLNRQNLDDMIERRTPMVVMDSHLLETNLNSRLDQNLRLEQLNHRLVNPPLDLHENQRSLQQNEHILPLPFHIKSEQEDDGYFYDNINQGIGNVNGLNGQIQVSEQSQPANLHQETQMYVYNHNISNIPALNPIDLYTRPQNYIQNFANNRDNPQNLVITRQYENPSVYDDFKKFRQDGGEQNGAKKEEPKENLKPTDQNKILMYGDCNLIYQNSEKSDLDIHEKLDEDLSLIKGEYGCFKCSEVLPSKRALKQHSKSCFSTVNGENSEAVDKVGKFSCTHCAYRCQSPAILKIHERTHSGEKPFSCTFCDYKSGQKNNVAKHILVHKKEKPFRCQYCDYRCAQKNNLVVHERTHTGYKPFACPYCDYRTVQKPNLVKHMYLHTDQKPFSCDMCSYRCVQKTNLTKHRQRHLNEKDGDKIEVKTQNKPYRPRQKSVKCPHCNYRCVQKSSLEKHIQFKHGQENLNAFRNEENFEMQNVENGLLKDDEIEFKDVDDAQYENEESAVQNLSVKKHEVFDEITSEPLKIQS